MGDDLIVGGSFTHAGSGPGTVEAPNIARWNGTAWSALGAGTDDGVVCLHLHNNELNMGGWFRKAGGAPAGHWARLGCACYANCDGSSAAPVLNVNDFTCFLNRYAAGEAYANCDGSSAAPVLNVNDFTCFMNRYAAGCP